ncbi:DUF4332 domain-containing protein [Anaerotalea alkaliphila]|uniref:DUF4332 domain-containing protein n=1 Tax=Anaerotalea alkaliphila TaxID=2662126 RepID=A0A7X5KMZ3_9FIRM|nr:DUF4332 domain-containing protein [Anaerotalea alkaliphila]NDL67484.1 DUF4332 domain-containing protein [Anaerotalea alkaliphila]
MYKLTVIEGMTTASISTLEDAGVRNVDDLLAVCATRKGRSELAAKTGFPEKQILTWANYADLTRIKGVGGEYAELLKASGVDTVPELATRNAEHLLHKLQETNATKEHVHKMPTQAQVADWIHQAATLPRTLSY